MGNRVTRVWNGWYNSFMESIIRNVTALDESHRRLVEALLGHELQDNQQLYIAVMSPGSSPTVQQKQQAWDRLQRIAAKAEGSLREQAITEEQWTAIVDEECESVRYGKKS